MKLTTKEIKLINSLEKKKYRKQYDLFVAQGTKIIKELLSSNFEIEKIYVDRKNYENLNLHVKENIRIIEPEEFKKISIQKTPQKALALVKIPAPTDKLPGKGLYLVLDTIQDPGNLGTILRLSDWFAIDAVFCTSDTVDLYSPKVVQSAMGAIFRVKTYYLERTKLIEHILSSSLPVLGTFLDGQNIYKSQLPAEGFYIIGNEAHGISHQLEQIVNKRLYIPKFKEETVESLNAAIATSILCSEIKRQNF